MSQDYTILVNFESERDANTAVKIIKRALGSESCVGLAVGEDQQEQFNNVMYDYCLSGASREPKAHWENMLKPAMKYLKPASIEFYILGVGGLELMETIKP